MQWRPVPLTPRTAMSRSPKRLPPMDASFLQIETREAPTHVASLQIFCLPDDAPRDFVQRVVRTLRAPTALARPWNLKLAKSRLSRVAPAVVEDHNIDLDYHVRHSALPHPGGERELGELISHLHGQLLDRSRPLWTCHVIEGLEGGRFALYCKVHHALVDGIRAMKLMTRCLGTAAGPGNWHAPWAAQDAQPDATTPPTSPSAAGDDDKLSAADWMRTIPRAVGPLFRRAPDREPALRPFEAPHSVLNGPVTAARRVATQRFDLGRVKAVARKANASVNDVFLAVCGSAVRRHLLESGTLPEDSLITGVPVSLRDGASNADAANAVGFVWARLGTDYADPIERLRVVRNSMRASKAHLNSLPPGARIAYTMATMMPSIGLLLSGMGPRFRPPMNLVISNVPGPDKPLWLEGARMEAMYPVSVLLQGLGLNITCVSYAGQLAVGFTGCRDGIPHLQRIAVYAADALDELEAAVLGATGSRIDS